ncbi:hypothetical protein A1O3_00830 [Capronia epimyces CBS 606.96]|uniref:Uncharacterized protein n=1 Tax=Capronia epimyces CBS 606.96 TaxID=1182542 RepID=W9YRG9_9EURO|nr:uncharacterized protein A1O3_00830 [Capronia epimyces CBS 606.96]EXJ92280.1 hypothetical protein A1O3_00830 [Capronia epimyces CBS 606.96]
MAPNVWHNSIRRFGNPVTSEKESWWNQIDSDGGIAEAVKVTGQLTSPAWNRNLVRPFASKPEMTISELISPEGPPKSLRDCGHLVEVLWRDQKDPQDVSPIHCTAWWSNIHNVWRAGRGTDPKCRANKTRLKLVHTNAKKALVALEVHLQHVNQLKEEYLRSEADGDVPPPLSDSEDEAGFEAVWWVGDPNQLPPVVMYKGRCTSHRSEQETTTQHSGNVLSRRIIPNPQEYGNAIANPDAGQRNAISIPLRAISNELWDIGAIERSSL